MVNSVFDAVRSRVSAELQKGPRGGGRDRDRIVLHIFANGQDWAKGLGIPTLAEKPDAEYLFWVGCAGSYDERNVKVSIALARRSTTRS